MSKSPTQRSLEFFRKLGFTCQVVEYWNQHAMRRVDLFGVIDIVAVKPGKIVGIQTTTIGNLSARRQKIRESDPARVWIESGARLVLQGWKWEPKERRLERTTEKVEIDPEGKLHFRRIFV